MIFKAYLENLYPTKSQEGIQIMINYLLVTRRRQESINTPQNAQNFHIYKISVPELPSNISSPEEASQISLGRFSSIIEIIETMLLSTCASLQISKIPTQPKTVSGSFDPIKWDHVVSSDDVEEDELSKITN